MCPALEAFAATCAFSSCCDFYLPCDFLLCPCDKIPGRGSLKEEGFIWVHVAVDTAHHAKECMMTKAHSWSRHSGRQSGEHGTEPEVDTTYILCFPPTYLPPIPSNPLLLRRPQS